MKTIDISGMGGGYEATCQKMLWNGIRYLEGGGAKDDIRISSFKNVVGVAICESDAAKALEKAMMEGVDDCTGAMHQCVIGHLLFIAKNGRDAWQAAFNGQPDRFYEIDQTTHEPVAKGEVAE